jgi:hypothetical protein
MFRYREIKARVRKRPFVPLRIVTSAGEAFDIHHPDLIMVGRRELTIGQESSADPAIYDGVDRVSIMHITAIKDLPRRRRLNDH